MKTNFYFRGEACHKLLMVLPVVTILVFALTSCGKKKNSDSTLTEVAPPPPPPPADPAFVEVDEMPVFPEGDTAILKFIAKNTKYPEEAKKNNIKGRVVVKFIVEKDCTVSNIEVVESIDPLLDEEAIRVVGTLPKFEKPAKKDGESVRVQYMLPITFTLK